MTDLAKTCLSVPAFLLAGFLSANMRSPTMSSSCPPLTVGGIAFGKTRCFAAVVPEPPLLNPPLEEEAKRGGGLATDLPIVLTPVPFATGLASFLDPPSTLLGPRRQAAGPKDDPAFQLARMLVGHWKGVVGKDTKIRFRFWLEDDGNMIVAEGTIGVDSGHEMGVHTSLGWDADAKQVYYLDQHGYKTIYFGHVTREGDDLLFDFKGLTGDSGHYKSREHFDKDTYQATMQAEANGGWQDMGLHITMHRVK